MFLKTYVNHVKTQKFKINVTFLLVVSIFTKIVDKTLKRKLFIYSCLEVISKREKKNLNFILKKFMMELLKKLL